MPPTTLTNTSCSCSETPAWRLSGGQQHGQAVGIETLRDAPRRAKTHAIDERLHLDQQRPAAIARDRDDAPGRGLAERAPGRWPPDCCTSLRPDAVMAKKPSSLTGAEAILGGAHDAVTAAGLALEIQHRIDQVLEQARAGDRALLRDVADDDHRGPGRLRKRTSCRGALAQLRRPRRRRSGRPPIAASGWNRSPKARRGARALRAKDRRQLGLARPAREPPRSRLRRPRAQIHLRHGLLAAGIDHGSRGARRARPPAAAGSACRCPGRLPARITEPGTIPPPRTRSSSAAPLPRRALAGAASDARAPARPPRPAPSPGRGRAGCAARANSTRRTAGIGPAI